MDTRPPARRTYAALTVARDRGVIWVCDISKSSAYLNSDELASDIETFLPRLHWVSSLAVHAVGGELIQWTGDGFIAWFPFELEREVGPTCNRILEAVWHFSAFINVTQLCVPSAKPFRIRHALTYEPDALVTRTTHQDGHESKIISGRNVVLAFRLSGVEADFPNVATQHRIEQAVSARTRALTNLKAWKPTAEQLLRHFKGEKMGTTGLYVSGAPRASPPPPHAWVTKAQRLVEKVEANRRQARTESAFARTFYAELLDSRGQDWCQDSVTAYVRWVRDGDAGALSRVLEDLEHLALEGDA